MDDVKFAFFVLFVQLQILFHGVYAVVAKRVDNRHLLYYPLAVNCRGFNRFNQNPLRRIVASDLRPFHVNTPRSTKSLLLLYQTETVSTTSPVRRTCFKPRHIRYMIPHSLFADEQLLRDVSRRLVLNKEFEHFPLAVRQEKFAFVLAALQVVTPPCLYCDGLTRLRDTVNLSYEWREDVVRQAAEMGLSGALFPAFVYSGDGLDRSRACPE